MDGKNELIRQIAERFSGHEVAPPEGAWEAISSQLTLNAATEVDHVNELFRERFADHGVAVDPTVWTNIGGQLGHVATVGGWGSIAAWAGAGIAALVLTGTVVWMTHEEPAARTVAQVPTPDAVVEQATTSGATSEANVALRVEEVTPSVEQLTNVRSGAATETALPRSEDQQHQPEANDPVQQVLIEMKSPSETLRVTMPYDPALTEDTRPVQFAPVESNPSSTATTTPSVTPTEKDPASGVDGEAGSAQPESMEPQSEASPEEPFNIWLQNAFSPNGDGFNDVFEPVIDEHTRVTILVVDVNSNQTVFSSDHFESWNGTYMNGGQACPEGIYLYAIEVFDMNGKAHTAGQVVNLLR